MTFDGVTVKYAGGRFLMNHRVVTRLKDIKMQERIMTLNNWKTTQKYTIRTYRFTII
jgi:hypothetical protein